MHKRYLRRISIFLLIIIYLKLWSYSSMLILLFKLVLRIKNLSYRIEILGRSTGSQFIKTILIICNWWCVLLIQIRRLNAVIIWTIQRIEFFTSFLPSKSCGVTFSDVDKRLFCNCLYFLLVDVSYAFFYLIINLNFYLTNWYSWNVLSFVIILLWISSSFIY
jgi:hypothetical protein